MRGSDIGPFLIWASACDPSLRLGQLVNVGIQRCSGDPHQAADLLRRVLLGPIELDGVSALMGIEAFAAAAFPPRARAAWRPAWARSRMRRVRTRRGLRRCGAFAREPRNCRTGGAARRRGARPRPLPRGLLSLTMVRFPAGQAKVGPRTAIPSSSSSIPTMNAVRIRQTLRMVTGVET